MSNVKANVAKTNSGNYLKSWYVDFGEVTEDDQFQLHEHAYLAAYTWGSCWAVLKSEAINYGFCPKNSYRTILIPLRFPHVSYAFTTQEVRAALAEYIARECFQIDEGLISTTDT